MRIMCGHCHSYHGALATVRACSQGSEISRCDWLIDRGFTEDGDPLIVECGADQWADPRGYACVAGHSHVYNELRAAEGWDYASDALEAQTMRRNGLDAVGPDGGSI